MNNSFLIANKCLELKCHYHLYELTNEILDVGNTVILPIINIFSLVTNLISIIIFLSKKMNHGINHYLLVISISDFIFSLACLFMPFIRCGTFCSFSYSYWSKFFELYFYIFITNSCLLFSLLIDIEMTTKKLLSFSTKLKKFSSFKIRENKLRLFFIILSAFCSNVPIYLLSREIKIFGYFVASRNNITSFEPLYDIENNSIGNNNIVKWILFGLTLFKGIFLISILLIINVTVFIKFKIYMENRIKTFGNLNHTGNNFIMKIYYCLTKLHSFRS